MKRVGHQILIDGSFEASQITLKDVSASSRPQHFYEQSNIRHIHLEHIILRITLHRQASDIGVITAARDVGILQPLQRTQIGLAPASWLHQTILILLILFGQLFGDRAETLTNVRLVLVRGILHHIIAIFLQNSLMRLAHLVHVIRLQEGIDRFRQSTDGYVQVQQVLHCHMNACGNGRFFTIAPLQSLDYLYAHAVCPKELLKVQRVHLYNVLRTHRNGIDSRLFLTPQLPVSLFLLVSIALYTK